MRQEKKTILVVINTLGHAGAEVALLEMLRHITPDRYRVDLYILMGQGEMVHLLPPHVRVLNKTYKDVSVLAKEGRGHLYRTVLSAAFRRGTIIRRIPYLLKNLIAMMKDKKIWGEKLLWRILADGGMRLKEEYDLAVSYLEGGSAYYVTDYVKAKKKATWVHVDYGRAGYTRALDLDCYLSFDRIFPVSDEVKDSFLKVYPECADKTMVFRNFINQEAIRERAKEKGGFSELEPEGNHTIRLLTIGRLTYQKAFDISIEAMKLIKDAGFSACWYVLGDGNQRQSLEKLIQDLGLQEDFKLLGAVNNPYPYLAQTTIYVHASRFEGKSIAIQEAQTLGCSIIASDCSGNREQIVPGVDGLLCDLTPESIKEAVVRLIQNEEERKRFGEAAKNKKIVHLEDLDMLLSLVEDEDEKNGN
ncbi:hypothetical protein FACS1894111_06760 [Clostridia bacterium]|nr:hypothetical protein FACS1894111_06760 [Clostridia bacterium]